MEGPAVLRSDPSPFFGSVEVVVALRGRRLLASIESPSAGEVAGLQVGDTLRVSGRTSRFAGELHVDSVSDIEPGRGGFALASGVRERIRASVEPRSTPTASALVLGAALGDDRSQSDVARSISALQLATYSSSPDEQRGTDARAVRPVAGGCRCPVGHRPPRPPSAGSYSSCGLTRRCCGPRAAALVVAMA
ncbi:MAG: hypothetical protein IPH81_20845 [Candidatus Microthrix sp.]|nr:hypothetical protein [Candidatus Microthrix sp.]